MTISAADILGVTKAVTKKWTKQRKAEERGNRSRSSRMYVYSNRVNFSDVAGRILTAAYDHASEGGKYSVPKRQMYYASREAFLQATGREITAKYLVQTVLRQYMNTHPQTASWKITADPRGTLVIPNAAHEVRVPCGTIQIDEHLASAGEETDPFDIDAKLDIEWPSLKHGERYQAVLYIEKEGFEPLLEEFKIAERYDLAIVSCKGQSVVAARKLVDTVCKVGGGVPLFVVHDFDKAGFEISQCLTTVSDWAEETNRVAYRFRNKIDVTDLGLRLADIEKYDLASETVNFKGHFADSSIATMEERVFLRSGRRVELNAFLPVTKFIEWLESKLNEHGLGKRLIPSDEVLKAAYRRALAVAKINAAIEEIHKSAIENAESATIPKTLRRQLKKAMKDSPQAWDRALYEIAKSNMEDGADD